ncbi:DUF5684 domain-containing protein [Microbacterium rhizomatis]|uniref:DUF5684 domain-containing protein n=1 Tax=Microbacterium rhizomatis TaxID=1631477 RepID=UPI001478E775|nr:DUF5684 domain-containing protein [Microbacterium rhizomatis]
MSDYTDPGVAYAVAWLIFLPFLLIFALAGYLLTSWFLMKIFDKAGVQGRWRAWVPVYNTLIFVKLGDLNPWWLLILWGAGAVLSWIPVLGQLILLAAFVYTLLAAWRVGLKLQKEAVWLILYFFLSIVWLGINAFDKSRWNTAIPAAPWATNFLADKTVWQGVPVQAPAGGYPANPVTQPAPGAYPPPPAGYQAPPAPPAGYTPPAPPAGAPVPPPATPPSTPPAATPPTAPEPPAAPPVDPDAPRI